VIALFEHQEIPFHRIREAVLPPLRGTPAAPARCARAGGRAPFTSIAGSGG
jgi:hypothetical protein